jgi:mRNA interferase MazF
MKGIRFGAIVLTDFPFSDLTATKRRPALVISVNNNRRTEVVVAYITSIPRNDFDDARAITPTIGTGLKVPSWVRFDKIATIHKTIIAGRIGNAEAAWLMDARTVFFGVFGFGSQAN